MRLLFLGDLVGRPGRTAAIEAIPRLRADWKLDFVAVNAENAASGFGCTPAIAGQLFEAGADCVTLGDHAFDQKEMIQHVEQDPRILRPLNYGRAIPGRGSGLFEATRGRKVMVAVALGRVFMNRPFEDPFSAIDAALKVAPLGATARDRRTPRRPPRRWPWATGATAAPASWSARTRTSPRPTPCSWRRAPPTSRTPACAATTTR